MSKVLGNSNEGFKHENSAKVAFIIGRLYDELPNEYADWNEIAILIENIVNDWSNSVDIRHDGEEGYIQEYAERIIRELISKHKETLEEQ